MSQHSTSTITRSSRLEIDVVLLFMSWPRVFYMKPTVNGQLCGWKLCGSLFLCLSYTALLEPRQTHSKTGLSTSLLQSFTPSCVLSSCCQSGCCAGTQNIARCPPCCAVAAPSPQANVRNYYMQFLEGPNERIADMMMDPRGPPPGDMMGPPPHLRGPPGRDGPPHMMGPGGITAAVAAATDFLIFAVVVALPRWQHICTACPAHWFALAGRRPSRQLGGVCMTGSRPWHMLAPLAPPTAAICGQALTQHLSPSASPVCRPMPFMLIILPLLMFTVMFTVMFMVIQEAHTVLLEVI